MIQTENEKYNSKKKSRNYAKKCLKRKKRSKIFLIALLNAVNVLVRLSL